MALSDHIARLAGTIVDASRERADHIKLKADTGKLILTRRQIQKLQALETRLEAQIAALQRELEGVQTAKEKLSEAKRHLNAMRSARRKAEAA